MRLARLTGYRRRFRGAAIGLTQASVWVTVAAICVCAIGVPGLCARAQQPVPAVQSAPTAPPPTGTVTGQVIAQDTQLPARFAQVTLQSVASASGGGNSGGFGSGGNFGGGFGGSVQTRTGVDGTFEANNVAPGDYYVMASAPGYIPERSLLLAQVAAGADPADLLARIPVVHVGPDSVSSVTVTMERGGTVAGRVVWEDGSPAAGLPITATLATTTGSAAPTLPPALQQIRSPSAPAFATTDDRGAFRISGLPSGDYLVQAVVQDRPQFGGLGGFGGLARGRGGSIIRVYSPGVFHKADAKPLPVNAGDERNDLRLVIDLRGLHTVSGHAGSTAAGQSVESGRVTLVDATDNSLSLNGSIDAHGDFSIEFVPPGNYTLQVSGASSQAFGGYRGRGSLQTPAVSFQTSSQAVVVSDTDVTGVSAMLTPTQSAQ